MSYTQLGALFRAGIGPGDVEDYSEDVTGAIATSEIQTVSRLSFANPKPIPAKSTEPTTSLAVSYDTNSAATKKLRQAARAAQLDNTTGIDPNDSDARQPGELYVEFTEEPGDVDDANPLLKGWALIQSLPIFGGTVNQMRSSSVTWPLRLIADPTPSDFS